ncbi:MAG: hypothetical protein K2N10_06230, partial [Muribaculaceae bacterium]|nr:hypothetical protein [Muribaculaceae bacterium]
NGGFIWSGKCKKQYIDLYPKELTTECLLKRGEYDETVKYSIPIYPNNLKTILGKILSYLPL